MGKRFDSAACRQGSRVSGLAGQPALPSFLVHGTNPPLRLSSGAPLPTGLLFEVGPDATQDPAGLASFRKLVKLYWGGADAEEILREAHSGVPSGAAALPFPGRSVLCSFRRDFRSLGAVLPAVGFPGAAEIYLAQIVEDSPGDAEAQYNLALSRREIGKTGLALSGVRAALGARPEFPEAENLLGVLLSQSRQLPEAHTHPEKATQQAPDFAEAWNNLGYTLLLQGELAAAGEALQKALSLAPDFPDALDNLGIVMAPQHNLDGAGELFRRALGLQPENEQAANNLGILYAQQGKTQDAVGYLLAPATRGAGASDLTGTPLEIVPLRVRTRSEAPGKSRQRSP